MAETFKSGFFLKVWVKMKIEDGNLFVSSRGLLGIADLQNTNPISSSAVIDEDFQERLALEPRVIYVNTDAVPKFIDLYFKHLKAPIVLMSGDSDSSVEQHQIEMGLIRSFIESNFLTAWYAQNLNAYHDKLSFLPIGIDYHTMWAQPNVWGLARCSPISQELVLLQILKESRRPQSKIPLAYCNWQFSLERGDRKRCFESVDPNAVFYENSRLPRLESWHRQSNFLFVISPEGNGIDCHRTWEALMLGQIAIIRRNAIAPMFEHLPVCIVDDWQDVNPAFLIERGNEMINKKFDFSKLFLAQWRRAIFKQRPFEFPWMTLSEYQDYLTARTFTTIGQGY
jgi:hypothetical protein